MHIITHQLIKTSITTATFAATVDQRCVDPQISHPRIIRVRSPHTSAVDPGMQNVTEGLQTYFIYIH